VRRGASRIALVAAGMMLFVSCAARRPTGAPRSPTRAVQTAPADAAVLEPLPSFASLVTPPPDMTEHARADLPPNGRLRLTIANDTCLRASVAGIDLARAGFEDETGPRGAAVTEAGLVPPKGPVCVRAGETLSLVVEARAARAIVYRSP
jgi:hypothetical protein